MTDFGADHAFGQVPKKLIEHYGIDMPVSTIRKITEFHGEHMHAQKEAMSLPLTTPGCRQQIAELDGCLLPIVTVGDEAGDNRKHKKLHWQEARLALVHEQGSVTPKFDASFGGGVDAAGQALLNCAVAAGFGAQTHVHGIGDGALWISGPNPRPVWRTSELSGRSFSCLRLLGSRLKNLCAECAGRLDGKSEEPIEKQ